MTADARLEALEDLLHSFATLDDGLFVSDFDGFCVGLVVCPEMIPPSEWLPVVWGTSKPPEFDDEEDLQAALDLIMEHYNDVAAALAPPSFELAPIYDFETHTEETLWEGWAVGFEQAMRLRPAAWEAVVDSGDEEAASSVLMLIELYNIADGKSELTETQVDELTEHAPDLIPELIFAINRWAKSQTQPAPFPTMAAANTARAPMPGRKVGRNEPCTCGSGRKYKRCCGGN